MAISYILQPSIITLAYWVGFGLEVKPIFANALGTQNVLLSSKMVKIEPPKM